jgi:hypothetical protein
MSIENLGQAASAVAGALESNGEVADQINGAIDTFSTCARAVLEVKIWVDAQVEHWASQEAFGSIVQTLQAAGEQADIVTGALGVSVLQLEESMQATANLGMELESLQTALDACR